MGWIFKNKKRPSETLAEKTFVKNKIVSQGKNKRALLVALFLVFNLLIVGIENTEASGCKDFNLEDTVDKKGVFSDGNSLCSCNGAGGATGITGCFGFSVKTKEECSAKQNTLVAGTTYGSIYSQCFFRGDSPSTQKANTGEYTFSKNENITNGLNPMAIKEGAVALVDNQFTKAISWVLMQVQAIVTWLFAIAATLFSWVISPDNISGNNGLLNKPAVKDVWIMVRDLLNMTFILVLLFAAFCTIFQVEKWNLKKVWLNILINALLVNFSYPIARFFIDVSNVAFYYFVNNLFTATGTTVTGSGIFAMFGSASALSELLKPEAFTEHQIAYQLAMIIVTFILGMTLLIVAALFVVRLLALTMIVMFSPIGFVGYIFPATASYADDWWKKLFSYSFFAPIMIFIMAIALRIAETLKAENIKSMMLNASVNTQPTQTSFIANLAFYMIPVIILWMGMGIAKSMGIAGADAVVGAVKKGGKWLANAPGHYSGINGGVKAGWKDMRKSGSFLGMNNAATRLAFKSGVADREAKFAGTMEGGVDGLKDAKRKIEDTKISDKMKEYKDRNYTSDQIAEDLDPKKDKSTQMAAVRALMADKGALGADPNRMIMALNIAGGDMALRNKIIDGADNFAGNDSFNASHVGTLLASASAGLDVTDPKQKAAKEAIEGKIKSKIKKENAKKLIDHEHMSGKTKSAAYKSVLESLNAEDFGKQKGLHENIGTDTELQSYIYNDVASDKTFHQEVFKNMKKGNRTEYVNMALQP